ncbi:MAG TPA: M20/M25/M40 family metallo-hydrolase, partial [Candidatus Eisenbacteria bacterium]
CGRALLGALPSGVEQGVWRLRDRREVVWARLRAGTPAAGGSRRALLLLGHHDTVGVGGFERLGAPEGEVVAFQPHRLHDVLENRASTLGGVPPETLPLLRTDLRAGEDWMFGRGALDMKSGLAAGVAALGILAESGETLGGDVLFVSCPDEEHESAGMLAAVGEIARLRNTEGLDLVGALNLDYGEGPFGYSGVMGKCLAGVYVLGSPTHAATPFEGADATQIAAAIVHRATTSPSLTERRDQGPGPPPVALRLRDLKPEYNAQTAAEAVAELNLLSYGRDAAGTLHALRHVVLDALDEIAGRMESLRGPGWLAAWPGSRGLVLTYPELAERAGEVRALRTPMPNGPIDARAWTLGHVRELVRQAELPAPAIVLYLAPPFHPHVPPGDGALSGAARTVLGRGGQELVPWYPYITDASYVAWRAESPESLAHHLPALGGCYHLPAEESRSLGLEVVTLGPWGRDPHGLFERVFAPYAFDTLPRLLAEVIRVALRG